MVMDRNPKFGADAQFAEGARRVADFLWENTGGDVTSFPKSYLENLRHEYSDGRVSMIELIDRVDLGPDASYDDYAEVIDALLYAEPSQWPHPDSVIEVKTDKLFAPPQDFSESFDFAEDDDNMSNKVEKFLKKVLSSIYTDGVTDVSDSDGNPPDEGNNYLLSEDGEEFQGVFYDKGEKGNIKEFPFRIFNNAGRWSVEY
jgi:hypothetical protein